MDREYPGSETACCELRVEEKEVERRVRVPGRIILAILFFCESELEGTEISIDHLAHLACLSREVSILSNLSQPSFSQKFVSRPKLSSWLLERGHLLESTESSRDAQKARRW